VKPNHRAIPPAFALWVHTRQGWKIEAIGPRGNDLLPLLGDRPGCVLPVPWRPLVVAAWKGIGRPAPDALGLGRN
jgi:hypothetical protein